MTEKKRDWLLAGRKMKIDLQNFADTVLAWQEARPPLAEANKSLNPLIMLLLGEIAEVKEEREKLGSQSYSRKAEYGEMIDQGFFLLSLYIVLINSGRDLDFNHALASANGQARRSKILDEMFEVAGNITAASLVKDLDVLVSLWVSDLIHHRDVINPTKILHEYIVPKNNGNYPEKALAHNWLFLQEFGREMDPDEKVAFFDHFRKAMRMIRDAWLLIDPNLEHTGLQEKHWAQYQLHIFNFYPSKITGRDSSQALQQLKVELDQTLVKQSGGMVYSSSMKVKK